MAVLFRKIATASLIGGGGFMILKSDSDLLTDIKARFIPTVSANGIVPEPTVKWEENWDKRDNGGQSPRVAMRSVILVKPGDYDKRVQVDQDRPLSRKGQDQMALTAKRLKDLNVPATKIYASQYKRDIQSAEIIKTQFGPDVQVLVDDWLNKGAPTKADPPVPQLTTDPVQIYKDAPRIEAAFRKYFWRNNLGNTNMHDILVCHSNLINYFVCRALQLPPEAWARINVKPASITWLVIRADGRVGLKTMGETGHLPKELCELS